MAAVRPEPPPALRGGSRGYSPDMRQAQIHLVNANAPGVVARDSSIARWRRNGVARRPKRGGHVAADIRGEEELYLVMCRLAWPSRFSHRLIALRL